MTIARSRLLALLACITLGAAPRSQQLHGVNFAGAEFGGGKLPGRPFFDYVYPSEAQLDWAAAMHFNVIRLPVLWERLQPALDRPLDAAELALVQTTVAAAAKRHIATVIDVHNYGYYRGHEVGTAETPTAAFADLWRRLAEAFRSSPRAKAAVIFGLMNEPHTLSAKAWLPNVQAAMDAIRQTGARNLVLVPGTGWDGAHNFVSGAGYGTPNAVALAALHDPADHMAFEVHQYIDADFSGTHPDCPNGRRAAALLEPFTAWLKAGHRHGFLGEFSASARPECLAALASMLEHMARNSDVWSGWTAWAAGAWWPPDYPFTLEAKDGVERPQMTVLKSAR